MLANGVIVDIKTGEPKDKKPEEKVEKKSEKKDKK